MENATGEAMPDTSEYFTDSNTTQPYMVTFNGWEVSSIFNTYYSPHTCITKGIDSNLQEEDWPEGSTSISVKLKQP